MCISTGIHLTPGKGTPIYLVFRKQCCALKAIYRPIFV